MPGEPVLEIKDLRVHFGAGPGAAKAIDGISLKVGAQRTLGLIGESGCGKSLTARSILRIIPRPGRIVSGEILLHGETGVTDIARLPDRGPAIRSIRGKQVAMIFQEPMTSLSPVHTVGNQIVEAVRLHNAVSKEEAEAETLDLLRRVGISNPGQRFREYPHQLSGGMRQRVMIAMSLAGKPRLLIADEPTTALDVTVQAQILELVKELQQTYGMSVLFITHDLGVINEVADDVAVMYLGRIVEEGSVREVLDNPLHPYTRRLLRAVPRLRRRTERLETIPGTVPAPIGLPWACPFASRCESFMPGTCDRNMPALAEAKGHPVRCFLHSMAVEAPPPAVPAKGGRLEHA